MANLHRINAILVTIARIAHKNANRCILTGQERKGKGKRMAVQSWRRYVLRSPIVVRSISKRKGGYTSSGKGNKAKVGIERPAMCFD